jgi:DNA-binding NtrC family response regulator
VHTAAIPENLVESELFGYARGAFTGAQAPRRGLVEEADGGTLFLDEIAETPLAAQVKLLRFLESNEVRRLGENEVRIVDVRVIAATNKDLVREMQAGRFREDLYYRLNVVQIELPPLRERREDIPLLAAYFLERYARLMGKPVERFAPDAQSRIVAYDYPGNVRELENAVERAVALAEGRVVMAADLPPTLLQPRLLPEGARGEGTTDATVPGRREEDPAQWSLAQVERSHIERVLRRHDYNMLKTAQQLGISRTTLWRKLKEYGIEKPRA